MNFKGGIFIDRRILKKFSRTTIELFKLFAVNYAINISKRVLLREIWKNVFIEFAEFSD